MVYYIFPIASPPRENTRHLMGYLDRGVRGSSRGPRTVKPAEKATLEGGGLASADVCVKPPSVDQIRIQQDPSRRPEKGNFIIELQPLLPSEPSTPGTPNIGPGDDGELPRSS